MTQILVYGDSLTWGIIPGTRQRLAFDKRWPGIVENRLNAEGLPVRVIENCLNGRRTVWEDPFKPGRNGLQTLAQVMEMHAPLALAVIALGTNDFQDTHDNRAWAAAQGVATLIDACRSAPVEPGMPVPEILVVAPPAIVEPRGTMATKFQGAAARCRGFAVALEEVAAARSTHFFDMNNVTTASPVDGVHLDADQHAKVGSAIASVIGSILSNTGRSG